MSTADNSVDPKPWDDEPEEPILPELVGDSENSLPDDVFERILAAAMDLDSPLADESLIPPADDPALTDEGAFVNSEEAELFLSDSVSDDELEQEEVEYELEDSEDLAESRSFDAYDFSSDDFLSAEDSEGVDCGEPDSDPQNGRGGVWG